MAETEDDRISLLKEEAKSLRNFNNHIQKENVQLREDLFSASQRESDLRESIQKLQFESNSYKQEIEDYKERLSLSEGFRADAQQLADKSLQEERFLHRKTEGELKLSLSNMKEETERLRNEIVELKRQNETTVNGSVFYEEMLSRVLAQSSTCFARNFENGDQLIAFLVTRPHFEAQREAEIERLKAESGKLTRELKKRKVMLKESQSEAERMHRELENLQLDFASRKEGFIREIQNAEKEVASLQQANERKLVRLRTDLRNAEIIAKTKKLLICRGKSITVAATKKELTSKLENMKTKYAGVKARLENVLEENENQRKENDYLKQKVQEYETNLSNLELEKRKMEVSLMEATSQFDSFRNGAENKEIDLSRKLKSAKERITSQDRTIDQLKGNLSELTGRLNETEAKLADQSLEVEQLRASVVETSRLDEISPMHFEDCYTDKMPAELLRRFRTIVEDTQTPIELKFKTLTELICEHYQKAVDAANSSFVSAQSELDAMTSAMADFIGTMTECLFNQRYGLKEFLEDPKLRRKAMNALDQLQKISVNASQQTSVMKELKQLNDTLSRKIRKLQDKDTNHSQLMEQMSLETKDLQTKVIQLQGRIAGLKDEKNRLQHSLTREKRRTQEALVAVTDNSSSDYEGLLNQLQKRCDEQRHTIQTLSHQISAKNAGRKRHSLNEDAGNSHFPS